MAFNNVKESEILPFQATLISKELDLLPSWKEKPLQGGFLKI
jgi:hypothetical protein